MWKCKRCGNEVKTIACGAVKGAWECKTDKNGDIVDVKTLEFDSLTKETYLKVGCTNCIYTQTDIIRGLKDIAYWEDER